MFIFAHETDTVWPLERNWLNLSDGKDGLLMDAAGRNVEEQRWRQMKFGQTN